MNREKQFETMAALRAYASEIANASPSDLRPSQAATYKEWVTRMAALVKELYVVS